MVLDSVTIRSSLSSARAAPSRRPVVVSHGSRVERILDSTTCCPSRRNGPSCSLHPITRRPPTRAITAAATRPYRDQRRRPAGTESGSFASDTLPRRSRNIRMVEIRPAPEWDPMSGSCRAVSVLPTPFGPSTRTAGVDLARAYSTGLPIPWAILTSLLVYERADM